MLLDIILIVIILLFGVIGIKKGFVQTLLSFAGMFLALVLALIFAGNLAKILTGTGLGEIVTGWANSLLSGIGGIMTTVIPTEDALLETLLGSMPKFIAEILASSIGGITGSVENMTVAEILTPGLANIFMTILSFGIIFIGSLIIFSIVKAIAKSITSLPILNTLDRIFGFVMGIIKGLVFVYVVFLLVSVLSGTEFMGTIMNLISESKLTQYMYNNNLILIIIEAFQAESVIIPTIS